MRGLSFLCLTLMPSFAGAETIYHNQRSGFTVTVPEAFTLVQTSANGDGATFTGFEGAATMLAYGTLDHAGGAAADRAATITFRQAQGDSLPTRRVPLTGTSCLGISRMVTSTINAALRLWIVRGNL